MRPHRQNPGGSRPPDLRTALFILWAPIGIACSADPGPGWVRHTIDDSFRGADGVDLRDLDQDGDLDAVVAWEESARVIVYENPGPAGVSDPWPKIDVAGGLSVANIEDAKFADLDSDGLVDAVVSATEIHGFRLGIHWLDGDWRSDAAWRGSWIGRNAQHAYLKTATGQLDDRHGEDIVAITKHKTVDGISYDASLVWFPSPDTLGPAHHDLWHGELIAQIDWLTDIGMFDLDADGDNDILVSDRDTGIRWFENRLTVDGRWMDNAIGPNHGDFAVCRGIVSPDDLGIAGYWAGGPVFYTPEPDGTWRQHVLPVSASLPDDQVLEGIKGFACGDLDRDGTTDIAISTSGTGHGVFAYLHEPKGWRFTPIAPTDRNNYFSGIKHDALRLADLDADGDLDVITTEENGGLLGGGLGVIWFENPSR